MQREDGESTAKEKKTCVSHEHGESKAEKKKTCASREHGESKAEKKKTCASREHGESKHEKKKTCASREHGESKAKKKKTCVSGEHGEPKADEDPLSQELHGLEDLDRVTKPSSKNKRKAQGASSNKASFKRPRGKGRSSTASTAAPSSSADVLPSEPLSEAEVDTSLAVVPAEPAEPVAETGNDDKWHSYDLKALGMPSECRPKGPGRGLHSYTLCLDGATFDVLMRKKGFYVKKPIGDGKKGTISWACNGGIEAAWLKAKQHAGLK